MNQKPQIQHIPLAAIQTRRETQPREQMDLVVAASYQQAMVDGSVFPPVDVFFDGEQYWLADGFHRVYAARNIETMTTIRATIHTGTQRDAILFSCSANVGHGLHRTNGDKRRAVLTLLQDPEWSKWSDVQISKTCNVSDEFVRTTRSSLPTVGSEKSRTYTTKHGTVAEMDTTRIGKSAKLVPPLLEALQNSVLRDDPHAINRLAGMDAEKQIKIAEVAAEHPEIGKVQVIWSRLNQQENQRRIDNLPEKGERWSVYHCPATALIERLPPKSVDVIITDPPYPKDYLTVYEDLSRLAAHVLKDGGLCVVMTGKQHLPTYMDGLGKALAYHWLVPIILTKTARAWDRKIYTTWKPLLLYVNGKYAGPTFHDVIHSEDKPPEKEQHQWQQGEWLMRQIVERFSLPAAVVLDPFCGAGTTGAASLLTDRIFIGADIDENACVTTRGRLTTLTEPAA